MTIRLAEQPCITREELLPLIADISFAYEYYGPERHMVHQKF